MQCSITCCKTAYDKALNALSYVSDALRFAMRLWMANIFWKSGMLKISNWDSTINLFTYEHPVPFLPPVIAAISGTFFELTCPILLTLGLAARLGTLPMLSMTAVIQFTYLQADEHIYWAFLLGTILCFGPGRASLDYWIKRKFCA